MYQSLRRKGVPAELHAHEQGSYGFAIETNRGDAVIGTVDNSSERYIGWLRLKEIVEQNAQT